MIDQARTLLYQDVRVAAEHLSKQSRESDSFALNPETFTDNWSTLMIERSGQIQGLVIYLVWLSFMVVLSAYRTP